MHLNDTAPLEECVPDGKAGERSAKKRKVGVSTCKETPTQKRAPNAVSIKGIVDDMQSLRGKISELEMAVIKIGQSTDAILGYFQRGGVPGTLHTATLPTVSTVSADASFARAVLLGELIKAMEHFVKTNTFANKTGAKELQNMLGLFGSMREIVKYYFDSKVGPNGCRGCFPQLEDKTEEAGKKNAELSTNCSDP